MTNNPYCQLADVKLALNKTNANDDAFLTQLIVQAQALLDSKIGYSFQQDGTTLAPVTRTFSGHNSEQMYIDDCLAITQVMEFNYNLILGTNGIWTNGTGTTTDITADTVLGPDNLPTSTKPGYLVYRLTGLPFMRGKQNYHITGVWGQPAIPADITRACIRVATHFYKMRDTNYADGIQANNVRERYRKELPADVIEIIQIYRRSVFFSR